MHLSPICAKQSANKSNNLTHGTPDQGIGCDVGKVLLAFAAQHPGKPPVWGNWGK
jgi:hypothetical protein